MLVVTALGCFPLLWWLMLARTGCGRVAFLLAAVGWATYLVAVTELLSVAQLLRPIPLAGAWGVTPPGWPPMYGKFLWGGLLIAALGTAFYMWRLYFLVFGGEERSEEAKKARESPPSMTMPLVSKLEFLRLNDSDWLLTALTAV